MTELTLTDMSEDNRERAAELHKGVWGDTYCDTFGTKAVRTVVIIALIRGYGCIFRPGIKATSG